MCRRASVSAALLLCVLGGALCEPSRVIFGGGRRWSPVEVRSKPSRGDPCGSFCQAESSKSRRVCQQPARQEGRRCADAAVRYTYVAATNSCVPFTYGGCGGNSNNFASFGQCRDLCKSPVKATRPPPRWSAWTPRRSWFQPHRKPSRHQRPRGKVHSKFQPSRGGGRIHFGGVGPRRGKVPSGVGPRRGMVPLGVGPRRGNVPSGVGPRRGKVPSGVGPRSGLVPSGVGPRRGNVPSGVGPRRGKIPSGVGPWRGKGRIYFPRAQPRLGKDPSETQLRRTESRRPCEQPARHEGLRCANATVRYTYVAATNSCVPFTHGGCGGNANNFASFGQCRDLCKLPPSPPAAPAPQPTTRRPSRWNDRIHFPDLGVGPRRRPRPWNRRRSKLRCQLRWQPGHCRGNGYLLRYYYNARLGSCQRALYSGCGGTGNRFRSRRACQRLCSRGRGA